VTSNEAVFSGMENTKPKAFDIKAIFSHMVLQSRRLLMSKRTVIPRMLHTKPSGFLVISQRTVFSRMLYAKPKAVDVKNCCFFASCIQIRRLLISRTFFLACCIQSRTKSVLDSKSLRLCMQHLKRKHASKKLL